MSRAIDVVDHSAGVVRLLAGLPAGQRGPLLQDVLSFQAGPSIELSFLVGPMRAAFAEYWEEKYHTPIPSKALRDCLEPPVPIGIVMRFNALDLMWDEVGLAAALEKLSDDLAQVARRLELPRQECLFELGQADAKSYPIAVRPRHGTVDSLAQLVADGCQYPTIYADPPWPYDNERSRGSAVNHYPVMPVAEIAAEPIAQLAAPSAHLHLWTTNAFLPEALGVIAAWGFVYKSCLVWVKPTIGMGNYWRVSHEYLLLGVRGNPTFRDRTVPSWILAERSWHSRKPAVVRELIERVSTGPYLELYGREELPDSAWTVYGNQIERRLF